MSCASGIPTFRLLDAYVGWDVGPDKDDYKNLTGLDDPAGVRLAQLDQFAVDPADILAYIPPARLARGCGPCDWYMVTPSPPAPCLLRLDLCTGEWVSVWGDGCAPDYLVKVIAVAAWRQRVAVSDIGAGRVWIWAQMGARLSAEIKIDEPGPIAFTPGGELLVVAEKQSAVLRFGPTGDYHGKLAAPIPEPPGDATSITVERIAVSRDRSAWLVTSTPNGSLQLWRAKKNADQFEQVSVDELAEAFEPTGITASSDDGFCSIGKGANGMPVTACISWHGCPVSESDIVKLKPPKRQDKGQLLTQAIDSGRPRCRWHRVRIDADIPTGTTLAIAVSTSEKEDSPVSQPKDVGWQDFPAGIPHPTDWQLAPTGSIDFLIDQPPGRYIFVRLRLTGDGTATPVVRRVRLDFPRLTSLEHLPSVYRENPAAEDFTERFLSLFDATIEDLDRVIERYPALLDADSVPDEVLPWLGSFLDLAFDRAWGPEQRRKILKAVPALYRLRGTVAGLKQAISLVFDIDEPVIQELPAERNWGALGRNAQLHSIRLFGKSRARFRVGSSPLSGVPLRSFGDPDQDPHNTHAYRFRVLVPPSKLTTATARERLIRLVESQKPAHTVAQVRVGGPGLILGAFSSVGIDTVFGHLPPPVLGKGGNIRLNRSSILWHGRRGERTGMILGQTVAVGLQTLME